VSKEKFRPNPAIPSAYLGSFILQVKDVKKEARSLGHNAKFFPQNYANMSPLRTGRVLNGKITLFAKPN
jgi:hypothetical protein